MSTSLGEYYDNPEYIDSGSFGKVYKAYSKDTGELVAVKEIDLYYLTDNLLNKIEQEFSTAQKLDHPNILKYRAIRRDEYYYLLEMELCDQSLEDVIRSQRYLGHPFQESYIWYVIGQIVSGLAYMHSQSVTNNTVVHRDLKPGNILFTDTHIKLGDFGLARETSGKSRMTTCTGTPVYMAPEVQRGDFYGTAADIWSLGCIILEICTLKPIPWSTEHLKDNPQITIDTAHYSEDLVTLIRSCLQLDSSARPTAAEIFSHPQVINVQQNVTFLTNDPAQIIEESSPTEHPYNQKPENWLEEIDVETDGKASPVNTNPEEPCPNDNREQNGVETTIRHTHARKSAVLYPSKTSLMESVEKNLYNDIPKYVGEAGTQCISPIKLITKDKKQSISIEGASALMVAAWYGFSNCVELLIEYEAGLVDSEGTTALMLAAQQDNEKVVEQLLKFEAGLQNNQGRTAMMFAAQYNNSKCTSLLAQHEAGMRLTSGSTALMIAAECGHSEIVQLLLRHEAGLQKANGWTALMSATQHGHSHIIKTLAAREATICTTTGQTALMVAAMNGQTKAVQVLKKELSGKQTKDGLTALMYAAQWNYPEIVKALTPIECNMVASDGRRAVQFAAEWGCLSCVDVLMDYEGDQAKLTNLMIAALKDDTRVAKRYIQAGQLCCTDSIGTTALMYAGMTNSCAIAALLLSAEAGQLDKTGYSSLMHAVAHGNVQFVRMLVPYEGTLASKAGRTAIDIAREMDCESPQVRDEIIACLEVGFSVGTDNLKSKKY
ncbi:Kinase, NEK [Giardia lamblia P15]|uniref:Kinase, NEK n=1 Tax=Giardia intestinalis (strain P15) TaxID=658858 RepID=E1F9S2_GIAIA|nr:Kinase, NEK [Giardia lamblia P15]